MEWENFTEDDPPVAPDRPGRTSVWDTWRPPALPGLHDDAPWEPFVPQMSARVDLEKLLEDLSVSPDTPSPVISSVDSADSDASDPFPDWVYEACQLVPKDMAGYKDQFTATQQEFMLIRGFTKVQITEIHSPHKFYFQLADDQRTLAAVMEDLRFMYSRASNDELTVREHEAKVNLVVAALYDDVWHRGRIISEPYRAGGAVMVKICYVDYGTVTSARLANVRFLHKKFLAAPEFCYRGSLSGIVPIGWSWTLTATKIFLSCVTDRIVYTYARTYCPDDRSWHLDVIDVDVQPNVRVNGLLIKRKVAKQAKNFDKQDITDYMAFYWREKPSFDELLSGKYPTYSELLLYKAAGIEFEPKKEEEEGAVGGVLILHETNPFVEDLKELNYRVITKSGVAPRPVAPPSADKGKDSSAAKRKEPPPAAQKKKKFRKRRPKKNK